jgi:tetratricopeptide (TPR) repeat protein
MQVKGKSTLVHATEVLGEADGWADDDTAPLDGRRAELEHLTAMIDGTIEAQGDRSVEVIGPAGIGKSHLVRHALRTARSVGLRTILCGGSEVRSRTPHGALLDAFPQLLRAEGDPSITLDLDDAVARRDAVHADVVAELIGAAAPAVLVVEDTQWLDGASRAFLGQLVAAGDELPWTIVLTRRSDGPPIATAATIVLGGLDLSDLLSFAVPALGSGWLEPDLAALHTAVGGSPLFFAEAVRRPRGTFELRAGSRSIDVLSQRLDELPPQSRRAVRALAVVARPLPDDVWAEIADQEIDIAQLRRHPRVVVEQTDGWWFTDEPLVDLAAAGLARREQRRVHARAAVVLDRLETRPASNAELAVHHHRAGNRAETWETARAAAAEARAAGSLRDAAELLQMAVSVIDDRTAPDDADGAIHDLAELLIALGRFTEADVLLRDAWRPRGAAPPVGALLLRARAAQQDGRYVAANRFLRRAAGEETCSTSDRIDIALLGGLVAHHQNRQSVAARRCWEALHDARRVGDDRRRARAHLWLEMIRWAQGASSVERHQACAEALFRRVGDARGLGVLLLNRGGNRILDGRWREALADCDEARVVLEGAGYLLDAAVAEMNANLIRVRRGEVDEALRRASVLTRTFRGLGWAEGVAYLDVTLAAAASLTVRHDEALRRLTEAEEVFERTHNTDFLGETRRQRALCHLRRRDPAQASAALDTIDPSWLAADPVLEVGVDWLGGHAAIQLGEFDRADVLLRRAARRAEERSLSYDLANVAWSLEQLAELTGADDGSQWRERRLELFASLEVGEALPPLPV